MKSKSLYSAFIGRDVIVRSSQAGVFVGHLHACTLHTCIISNSRRLWSWNGALSVSEIARSGITGGKLGTVDPEQAVIRDACEIRICADGVADRIRSL